MSNLDRVLIISSLLIFATGCNLINTVSDIYNEDVEAQKFSYEDKSLVFVPIIHFGQEVYYNNLRDSIVNWKSNGYTVFYEEISVKTKDAEKLKLYNLKWRKISGGTGKSRADYAQLEEAFEGGIAQPEYDELGIDSTDVNADISFGRLVEKYEEVYGEVILGECDRSTPLTDTYECGEKLSNDLSPVILHYRNEELAKKLASASFNKIVVIYGKDHMEGVQEILKSKGPLETVE